MMGTPIILADNAFLDGIPTATDTASGYDVLNIRDLKTYTEWAAASGGTKYLTIDRGSAKAADALGIFKHNLGTAAASVSVESSDTGAWAGEEVQRLAPFTPTNDKAILKTFTSASARYWRVKIVTAGIAPRLAVCLLGARLTFSFPPESPFAPARESVEGETRRSKMGQVLGTVVRFKPYRITPTFKFPSRAWADASLYPWWENWASNLWPFFWAWDLDLYASDVRFVKVPDGFEYEAAFATSVYCEEFRLELEGVKE
jgi:hypothetical protein